MRASFSLHLLAISLLGCIVFMIVEVLCCFFIPCWDGIGNEPCDHWPKDCGYQVQLESHWWLGRLLFGRQFRSLNLNYEVYQLSRWYRTLKLMHLCSWSTTRMLQWRWHPPTFSSFIQLICAVDMFLPCTHISHLSIAWHKHVCLSSSCPLC